MPRIGTSVLLLFLTLTTVGAAQAPAPVRDLAGTHGISLSLGLLAQTEVSPGRASVDGVIAGLSYLHWVSSDWAFGARADMHGAEAASGTTASVVSLLVSASWYPPGLAVASLRPFAAAAVGPYIGSETDGIHGSTGTRTVLGARLGGGVDVFSARWLRLGLQAAYHFAPDFHRPVGSVRSASGPQLSLDIGVLFGGRSDG